MSMESRGGREGEGETEREIDLRRCSSALRPHPPRRTPWAVAAPPPTATHDLWSESQTGDKIRGMEVVLTTFPLEWGKRTGHKQATPAEMCQSKTGGVDKGREHVRLLGESGTW